MSDTALAIKEHDEKTKEILEIYDSSDDEVKWLIYELACALSENKREGADDGK